MDGGESSVQQPKSTGGGDRCEVMAESEITLGEVSRTLASLEGRINTMFGEVNRRLDNLQFVTRDVYELQVKQLNERIAELEDDNQWNRRTLVGSFLFPLLVAALGAWVMIQ